MNKKMKLLAIGLAIMISISGMAAYTIITINTTPHLIRVACVGDSITQGSGYPQKLQMLLGSNYTVRNFGVSGSTVSLNSTLPYMNQTAFRRALVFDPDIVVIMLGTNDANLVNAPNDQSFEADYTQLVTSFQELAGDHQIFVLRTPPIFNNNANYSDTILASTVIPQIDNLANQMNLPEVDIYDTMINHSEYFMDGVHPSSDGATIIASTVYDSITSYHLNS